MNSNIPNLSPDDDNSSNIGSPASSITNPSKIYPLYIAINEYQGRMDDELNMQLGDKIQVITDDEEYNDGWYYGKNLRTQQEGLYPVVFTQQFVPERTHPTKEKSSRRISTIMTNTTLNSTSELPTPQKAEKATWVSSNTISNDRSLSLKKTMSEIDRALEELQVGDSEISSNVNRKASDISTTIEVLDIVNETAWKPEEPESTINTYRQDLDGAQSRSASNNTIVVNKLHIPTSTDGIPRYEHVDPTYALNWTPEDVTDHFIAAGFDPEVSTKFKLQKISGKILLELELSHLKELDIDSFGTRFEVFKEIESIKKAVENKLDTKTKNEDYLHDNSASGLMPAAYVNENEPPSLQQEAKLSSNVSSPTQDAQTPIRSINNKLEHLQGLAEGNVNKNKTQLRAESPTSKYRPVSLVLTPDIPKTIPGEGLLSENMFTSPRKAPKPPSYPSPVQPPSSTSAKRMSTSPMLNSPSTHYRSLSNEKPYLNINTPKAKSNSDKFKFPQSSGVIPNNNNSQMNTASDSRKSTIYSNHRKSVSGGSFVDLYNRVSLLSPKVESKNNLIKSEATEKQVSHNRQTSNSSNNHSRKVSQSNIEVKSHRRNSSLLSFFSGKNEERPKSPLKSPTPLINGKSSHSRNNSYAKSPYTTYPVEDNLKATPKDYFGKSLASPTYQASTQSPIKEYPRRTVSALDNKKTALDGSSLGINDEDQKKRSISEIAKGKTMHKMSGKPYSKRNTTAFVEGIRTIKVKDAIKDADCSGWLNKKGSGAIGVWKTRFFTLHGTRLSYFSSSTDTRERGLIDITGHRVVPVKDDDKIVSLYAASTGKGRFCFKLVPPQPGAKKGLTFTQPRVHYFAVDTKDDMRAWMSALIKSTIDIATDTSVVSSYSSSTISLSKAKEMLSQARQESVLREQGTLLNEEDEDQLLWEQENSKVTRNNQKNFLNRHTIDFSMTKSKSSISTTESTLTSFNVTSEGPIPYNKRYSAYGALPGQFNLNFNSEPKTEEDNISLAASSHYSD